MITMVLGGLWHGASWTFVVWGMLHGSLLIVHRIFRDLSKAWPGWERALTSVPGTALRMLATFLCICFCWVFFRATTFGAALQMLHRLVIPHAGWEAPLSSLSLWYILLLVGVSHALAYRGLWKRIVAQLPAPALGTAYATAFTLAFMLAPGTSKTFIYFQF
jgi:alginate O-acetyltransferase complex protein AlgI